MNTSLRNLLNSHLDKDIKRMIRDKKLNANLLSVNFINETRAPLKFTVLVDVLNTSQIRKIFITIENIDELFYGNTYIDLDRRANIENHKFDALSLARLRVMRIAYEAINHIMLGWEHDGCYRKNSTLALDQDVDAYISDKSLIIYQNHNY